MCHTSLPVQHIAHHQPIEGHTIPNNNCHCKLWGVKGNLLFQCIACSYRPTMQLSPQQEQVNHYQILSRSLSAHNRRKTTPWLSAPIPATQLVKSLPTPTIAAAAKFVLHAQQPLATSMQVNPYGSRYTFVHDLKNSTLELYITRMDFPCGAYILSARDLVNTCLMSSVYLLTIHGETYNLQKLNWCILHALTPVNLGTRFDRGMQGLSEASCLAPHKLSWVLR